MGNKQDGYIKLYRSIKEWCWYNDINTLRVWIHILLSVSYKDRDGIAAGHILISADDIGRELHISRSCVFTALRHLVSTGEITVCKSGSPNKKTLYKVNNWERYQTEAKAEKDRRKQEKAEEKPNNGAAKKDDQPWLEFGWTKEEWELSRI